MTETQTKPEAETHTAKPIAADTNASVQPEIPFATVKGTAITQLPEDLYIPPDALEVILEAFSGPLDLLLYLIRRQNVDILDIPIADITHQYVEYIQLMQDLRLELAAEYLVMAAILAEIKSRMLLPRPVSDDTEDNLDPRAELIRRLQEYERFKQAATDIQELPQLGRDVFLANAEAEDLKPERPDPTMEIRDLLMALQNVLQRADLVTNHQVQGERLSMRERMVDILDRLKPGKAIEFEKLFTITEGRMGVVVSFIAILELLKEHLIDIVQKSFGASIYLKAADAVAED